MSKSGSKFLLAACAIAALGLLLWSWNTQKPEVTAAFLQAILSAAAIFASVLLASIQRVQERRRSAETQLKELVFATTQLETIVESTNPPSRVNVEIIRATLLAIAEQANLLKVHDLPISAYPAIFTLKVCCASLLSALDRGAEDWLAARKLSKNFVREEMKRFEDLARELDQEFDE